MPQPLSKQILTLSLPHNSWEPGKHQPASSTPVKQGSSIHVLKREPSYQNCKLFAHSTLSGSTKNCALILQETSSSDPSPLLVAETQASSPRQKVLPPCQGEWAGGEAWGHSAEPCCTAGYWWPRGIMLQLLPLPKQDLRSSLLYFSQCTLQMMDWFWPKSGEAFSLCIWERSTAPLASKSLSVSCRYGIKSTVYSCFCGGRVNTKIPYFWEIKAMRI